MTTSKTWMEFSAVDGRVVVALEDIQVARQCGEIIHLWLQNRAEPFSLNHTDCVKAADVFEKLLSALGKP